MNLLLRNVLVNVRYYAVTLVALPWLALWLETRLGWARQPAPLLAKGLAVLVGGAGAILQLWCIALFHRYGGGTPSPSFPAAPPVRLVTGGPYRYVRNPMNVGELAVFVALAGWFWSPALALYAGLSFGSFHAFAVFRDEPWLSRTHGEPYRRYCAKVPRWWPRTLRPWQPDEDADPGRSPREP